MKSLWRKSIVFMALAAALVAPLLVGSAGAQTGASLSDLSARKSLGSPHAPITIEVFGDYQCSQCRVFFETTAQQLINNYVSTGKVYLVHRDFPLSMHSYSRQAARWLNAAAAAGKFEIAERVLYAKQDEWGATGQIEQALANAVSPVDMNKIREIASTRGAEIDTEIQRDIALANSRNVTGTPTIYVTHRGQSNLLPIAGVSYSLLKQYLDYLLQN